MVRLIAAIAAALVLAPGAGRAAENQNLFTLSSPAFADGATLPLKYAGGTLCGADSKGGNLSPSLAWSNPPAGTKSYAVLMIDPDGRRGLGSVHWVAYGIPASVTGFAEGEVSGPSEKYVGGKSTPGLAHYFGPCTPPGDWHHYTFTLIATDLDPKALEPGLTRDQLFEKLAGHTKGAAGLIGRFTKP